MKKRVLAVSLILSLFLSAFAVSCKREEGDAPDVPEDTVIEDIAGSEDHNAPGSETSNEDVSDEELPRNDAFDSIPSQDFGGKEFVILTTDTAFCESEEDKGIIGSELYARNRAIEEKFNIKLTFVSTDSISVKNTLQQKDSVLPDLVYAPQDTIALCAGSGLLMNIYSVPYFRYSQEHTEPALISSLSQSDTTYGVYGDAAYDEKSVYCVYYNKDILSFLGFVDAYDLVRENKWTWDMFLAISEGALLDLNEDGRFTASADRFGYSSSMNTSTFANAVFASFGKKFFIPDEEGFLKMNYDQVEGFEYIDKLKDICSGNKAKYPAKDPGAEALKAFEEGRLAFFCEKLSVASSIATSDVRWGILPMPKLYAEAENYCSYVDRSVCGYAVPYGVSDSCLSGLVLDAIYAYNSSYGKDVCEKNWVYHYLPDNTAALAMLEVLKNPVYDIAYAFGEGMPEISIASYDLLQQVIEKNVDFSYLYKQNQKPFSEFIRNRFVN